MPRQAEPKAAGSWITFAAGKLREQGIDRPRAEARYLLSTALNLSQEALVSDPDLELHPNDRAALNSLLERRCRLEPMAYIRGRVEFFGLSFVVKPGVLIPRPETELLVEGALAAIEGQRAATVLEFGVGSGCILISILKHAPTATGWGVDLSMDALRVAHRNADLHGTGRRTHLFQGDWGGALRGSFDLIIANPPYIPSSDIDDLMADVRNFEPRMALDGGPGGLKPYSTIAGDIKRLLHRDGTALLEFGADQAAAIVQIFENTELVCEIIPDLSGLPRVAKVKFKKF